MKRVEVVLDPPKGDVPDCEHDFVTVYAEAESEILLRWFMRYVHDRVACQFDIEDVSDEKPDCLGVIPGTFIACGEGGNYCRPACQKKVKDD